MPDEKPIVTRILDWHDKVSGFWGPIHDGVDEDLAFLDGDRYEQNNDFANRDRRLIQIKGRETEDAIRHAMAIWSQRPRNLQAKPRTQTANPDMAARSAELMLGLVDWEQHTPWKLFEEEIYKAVRASKDCGCGVMWMEFDPNVGQWGEIIYQAKDCRNLMWDPAFHPHHILNRQLLLKTRIDVDEAREAYNADWLEPDRMYKPTGREHQPDRPPARGGFRSPGQYEDDKVSIWQCWYKHDRTYKQRDGKKEQILPAKDRYMACVSGCGFRSPRQSDMGQPLPEMAPNACPVCAGNLERIDSLGEQESVYSYSRGRRLVIIAPWQTGSPDEPLQDGSWPVSSAISYPMFVTFWDIRSGGRPWGHSVPSWYWDQQIAADQLDTLALERAFEHRNLWVLPRTGLYDRSGRRYEMRDDQENVMFRDATDQNDYGPLNIQAVNATGLDPSWPIIRQSIQQRIMVGKADFGLTQQNSKDIAASTVAQLVQQQELPEAEYGKRFSRDFSMFTAVQSDYIAATYPPNRLTRLGIQGMDLVLPMWGRDLPGFDFEVEESPEFTGTEQAQVDGIKTLMQTFQQTGSMALTELVAKAMKIAPSIWNSFEQAVEEQKAEQEQQAMQDMQAGLPVPGLPIPGEEMGMMGQPGMEAGPNGPDMGSGPVG